MKSIALYLLLLLALPICSSAKTNVGIKRSTDAQTNPAASQSNTLLSFTVSREGEQVLINWSTAGKDNNDFFTLERSESASEWQKIAKINNAEYSNEAIDYSFADHNLSSAPVYYRLKETNFYGGFTYSKVVSVTGYNRVEVALTRLP